MPFLARLLSAVIPLALAGHGLVRVITGREAWADLRARWSGTTLPAPYVWLHAASVGEAQSARAVLTRYPGTRFLVTVNTTTGRDRVAGWNLPNVTAAPAPFDRPGPSRRMLAQAQALIIVENELWPRRLRAAHRARVPVLLISARMSARSAARWQRTGAFGRALLDPVRAILPQDDASATHFARLTSAPVTDPLPLKSSFVALDRPIPTDLTGFTRSRTVLAAATHPGEEEAVLSAYTAARETRPDLRLILAPRHPERGAEVAGLIRAAGLSFSRRSAGQPPDGPVYLADTLGEMDYWYRLSGVAFIGGSLVDRGGHTPFEPTAYGCPILIGPSRHNFQAIYADLLAAGGAQEVRTTGDLTAALLTDRSHPDAPNPAAIAATVLQAADLTPLWDQLDPILRS